MSRWNIEVWKDSSSFGLHRAARIYGPLVSEYQVIELIQAPDPWGRALILDGVFQLSEGDEHYYHEMLVHPPLAVLPGINNVLIIGGGDGGTAREVLRHPETNVTMVEIDPEVVEVCKEYLPKMGDWDNPRLEVRIEDGVEFVKRAESQYDVIIVDGTDPVGPGEILFTKEFYEHCQRALVPGGVLTTQSGSPYLQRDEFERTVRTLKSVFKKVWPYFGSVPVYGCGPWSWTWASDETDPFEVLQVRADRIMETSKVWTINVHEGAFAVPNEFRELADFLR